MLMIQEVTNNPDVALTDLVVRLNALYPAAPDWAYSWCGCCISGDAVAEATVPADIGQRTGARTEGYAVVWRRNQGARFTMIPARYPIASGTGPAAAVAGGLVSPLNISQRGRPTAADLPFAPGYTAAGGYTTAAPYPYLYNAVTGNYDLMAAWPRLDYPTTGALDPSEFRWAGARRPAYVVLRLADAPRTLCPVGVYHAPSRRQQSTWAAIVTGFARELYAINNVDAANQPVAALVNARTSILGGDFNYEEHEWPGYYANFTALMRRAFDGGANCQEMPERDDPDDDRRTVVQLSDGPNHDHVIVSPNVDAYLTEMIDVVFYRRLRGITGERVNLLDELIGPAGPYAGTLTQAGAVMAHLEAGVAGPDQRMVATGPQLRRRKRDRHGGWVYSWVPRISGPWGSTFVNWAAARGQYTAGAIADARRSAEYVNMFVSDHLPLVVTVPV